jgi:hypothetical protein
MSQWFTAGWNKDKSKSVRESDHPTDFPITTSLQLRLVLEKMALTSSQENSQMRISKGKHSQMSLFKENNGNSKMNPYRDISASKAVKIHQIRIKITANKIL